MSCRLSLFGEEPGHEEGKDEQNPCAHVCTMKFTDLATMAIKKLMITNAFCNIFIYLCVKRKAEKMGYITEEEAASQFIHNPPSSTSKIEEPAPKAQQEIDRATEIVWLTRTVSAHTHAPNCPHMPPTD